MLSLLAAATRPGWPEAAVYITLIIAAAIIIIFWMYFDSTYGDDDEDLDAEDESAPSS